MYKKILVLLIAIFGFSGFAAQSLAFNTSECLDKEIQRCNETCANSDDRDCPDQCPSQAKKICHQKQYAQPPSKKSGDAENDSENNSGFSGNIEE